MIRIIFSALMITNGEPSHVESVVKLLNKGFFVCSGVLIDSELVLTAAHCVTEFEPEDLAIDTNSKIISAKTVAIHDDYDTNSHQNDLAIIELEEDSTAIFAEFSSHISSDPILAVGFGLDENHDRGEQHQRSGEIAQKSSFFLSFSGACFGDSGGGVFQNNQLIGIITHGDEDCAEYSAARRVDGCRNQNLLGLIPLLWVSKKRHDPNDQK